MPTPKESPLRADPKNYARKLKDVLLGELPIGLDDTFLSALVHSGSHSESISRHADFVEQLDEYAGWGQLTIVGNRYRSNLQQHVLANKSAGTLVLLMREPRNAADPNAVACLMTRQIDPGNSQSGFTWVHVGYLPQNTAAGLAPLWPIENGLPMVVHATLRESKQKRMQKGIVELSAYSENYSSTVFARDLSMFL